MEQCDADSALGMARGSSAALSPSSTGLRRLAFVTGPGAPGFNALHEAIAALGHKVLSLSTIGPKEVSGTSDTIDRRAYDPAPEGWSFLQARRATQALSETLKDWRASAVISAGAQTALLAASAAEQAGIKERTAIVLDRFDGSDAAMVELWRKAFALSTASIFLNRDDQYAAIKADVMREGMPAFVVPGAGVDLAASPMQPLPPWRDEPVVLIHVDGEKHAEVKLALKAVSELLNRNASMQVRTSGLSPGRDYNLPARVEAVSSEAPAFEAALEECHIYVHVPGNAGIPTHLLAALAAGRPVIATSTPGCHDMVDDAVNGCLVEQGSVAALTKAIELFVKNPELLAPAAHASRMKAERRFNRRDINQAWLKALALS